MKQTLKISNKHLKKKLNRDERDDLAITNSIPSHKRPITRFSKEGNAS